MMKKILSAALCVLLLAALPFSAAGSAGRDTVRYDTNGGYILVDRDTGELVYADPSLAGDVVIPPSVSGVAVTSILIRDGHDNPPDYQMYRGFGGCHQITSLTLPGTVEQITGLGYMENLQRLVLQEGVKSCNAGSFSGPAMKEIVLPKTLETISGGGFGSTQLRILLHEDNPYFVMDEQNLLYSKDRTLLVAACGVYDGEYVIADTVRTIGECAFSGNTAIRSITFPENVQKIGTRSFQYCTGLEQVTFQSKSVSMVTEAFMGCTALREVLLPSEEVVLGTSVFANCTSLQSISLPPTGSLGLRSFTGSGLTHISIPADFQFAASYTFEYCRQLKTVVFRDGFQAEISRLFYGCDALESIRIPETVKAVELFGSYTFNEFGTSGPADVVIKGKRGSAAGRTAKENLNRFESEGDIPLPFGDSTAHWAKSDIEWVFYHYMMDGVSQNRFSPDTSTSRAMFVTMLKRLDENYIAYNRSMRFTDVPYNSYYQSAVYWAAELGITNGAGENLFAPNAAIRREDMAVMLMRYAARTGMEVSRRGTLSPYEDATAISTYAREAVEWAVYHGILQGSGGKLRPQTSATRAETAAMLRRFADLMDGKRIFNEDSGNIDTIQLSVKERSLSYKLSDAKETEAFFRDFNALQYAGAVRQFSRYTEEPAEGLFVDITRKDGSYMTCELFPSRINCYWDTTYTLKQTDSYLAFIDKWKQKLTE